MFQFQLRPEFKARTASLIEPLAPVAQKISPSLVAGLRHLVVGGVAGWSLVVVVGAVLMANDARDKCCVTEAPPASTSSTPNVVEPVAPPHGDAAAPVALAPPAPAPAVKTAKSTQRVDMAPTAAIPSEAHPKLKHKPHKKKIKDLDTSN